MIKLLDESLDVCIKSQASIKCMPSSGTEAITCICTTTSLCINEHRPTGNKEDFFAQHVKLLQLYCNILSAEDEYSFGTASRGGRNAGKGTPGPGTYRPAVSALGEQYDSRRQSPSSAKIPHSTRDGELKVSNNLCRPQAVGLGDPDFGKTPINTHCASFFPSCWSF